jgi:hypothetical protein
VVVCLMTAVPTANCQATRGRASPREPQVASVDAYERATLSGLLGVFVTLDGVTPDLEALGLHQAELLASIQDQLRTAGVRVLAREDARNSPGSPYLYFNINVVRAAAGFAYTVRIELNQAVSLARSAGSRTMATTWQPAAVLAAVNPTELVKAVRQDLGALVTIFVDDYREANHAR